MNPSIVLLELLLIGLISLTFFFFVSWRKPIFVLLLPITFFIAGPQYYISFLRKFSPALMSIVLLLCFLAAQVLLRRQAVRISYLTSWMLVVFCLLCCISTLLFGSHLYYNDSFILKDLGYILILYFAMLIFVRDEEQLNLLLKTLVVCGLFLAVLGMIEYLFPGFQGIRVRTHHYGGESINRTGTRGMNPNTLGVTLLMIAPLLYYYMSTARSRIVSIINGGLLFFLLIVTVLTISRAAFLCMALATSLMLVNSKYIRSALLIVVVLALILYFAPDYYWVRIGTILTDTSGNGRAEIWEAGIRMIKDNLWWGVGFGNFNYEIGRYTPILDFSMASAHNMYIQLLAETGIFITFFYLTLIVNLFFDLKRIVQLAVRAKLKHFEILVKVIRIVILIYLVHGLFSNDLKLMLFFIYVGIIGALKGIITIRTADTETFRRKAPVPSDLAPQKQNVSNQRFSKPVQKGLVPRIE